MKLTENLLFKIKDNCEGQFHGGEGSVYLKGNYALKEYNDDKDIDEHVFEVMMMSTNYLRDRLGINTPKIYDYMMFKHGGIKGISDKITPYLFMERAKGTPVYAQLSSNLDTLLPDDPDLGTAHKLSKYCIQMAEKLADGDQKFFDKFAEDVFTTLLYNNVLIDKFGENIYFDDKTGFSLLDLWFKKNGLSGGTCVTREKGKGIDSIRHGLYYITLEYIADISCGIWSGRDNNIDPDEKVKPIYEKTYKALSKISKNYTKENTPIGLDCKIRGLAL